MNPAQQLLGRELAGGWKVIELVQRGENATGGAFSTGYVVVNPEGRRGFLKAMDYFEALNSPNAPAFLNWLTQAYLFEKAVCDACRGRQLDRVVHAIDAGTVMPADGNIAGRVEYLIFELADGDVRKFLDRQKTPDIAFNLRVLHHVATGIEQLHSAEMAHQDLKPSNVLVFNGDRGSKVTDLGRAWARNVPAPHDTLNIAGAKSYAPPEAAYGAVANDEQTRRFGCDMYHFGNLICFLFARVHINGLLTKHLAPPHRPGFWSGSFEDVLPYLKVAFDQALTEVTQSFPPPVAADLTELVRQLCEPDPKKRGHPLNRIGHGSPFGLDRFISRLNALATKAEIEAKR